MSNNVASPVRKFFEHYLTVEKGLSSHTILAYRDTLKLLLRFAADHHRKSCVELTVDDISAETVRLFLIHLEKTRGNGVRTRNARLAAIHCFFRYLAYWEPRFLTASQEVLGIPFKRHAHPVMGYLNREEVVHLFNHIDTGTSQGKRDEAILRLIYNTGARAHELVGLDINHVRFSRPYLVHILGKGRKERTCPLWPETVDSLKKYLEERRVRTYDRFPLFVNAKGQRLSRFGLRYLITRRVTIAAKTSPTLLTRKIGPHTFRHTTAMHLLQSGVDLNMIRSWLGHSSIETTNGYVEIDLEMKRKTLQSCENLLPKMKKGGPSWQRDQGILDWLVRL
jgi:site-specific recombinase XerD